MICLTHLPITPHPTICSQPEDPDDPLSASSAKLPTGVSEMREKTFRPPPGQRGEGEPSAKLRQHLGIGRSRRRASDSAPKVSLEKIMLDLFLFFFPVDVLNKIADYTNQKATEVVWKYRVRRKDHKVETKVHPADTQTTHTHTYTHTRTRTHIHTTLHTHPKTLSHSRDTCQPTCMSGGRRDSSK